MSKTKFHCAKCDILVVTEDVGTQPVIPAGWQYKRVKNFVALFCDKC